MAFEPIAIIGSACVMPGALSPEQLWENSLANKNVLQPANSHQWGVDPQAYLTEFASIMGGYVTGFEDVFEPYNYAIDAEEILQLDVLFHWLIHAGRSALLDAGYLDKVTKNKINAVFGNIFFPTKKLCELSEHIWLSKQDNEVVKNLIRDPPSVLNRYMSGYPADFLTRALGLTGYAFCLDAACASSLYSIKLACDQLQAKEADLVLAGGVNAADDMLLHGGFDALRALSPTGMSMPLSKAANGLVPAQGCGFIVLKRLVQAVQDKDDIVAVIRGVGLSNDGNRGGLLMPSRVGQAAAMKNAYEIAELDPTQVSYIECHAAGIQYVDSYEVDSLKRVFGDEEIHLAALKSNVGDMVSASGIAAVIRLIQAFKYKVIPPTSSVEDPIKELCESAFKVWLKPQEWDAKNNQARLAAVNGFGLGGNNAHLILEEWADVTRPVAYKEQAQLDEEIAVVSMGVLTAHGEGQECFARVLFGIDNSNNDEKSNFRIDKISLPFFGLRFPPNELRRSQAQQLAIMNCAIEAIERVNNFKLSEATFIIGAQCNPDTVRYRLRWQLKELLKQQGIMLPEQWEHDYPDTIVEPLCASHVTGSMLNNITNQLNVQFDSMATSYVVSDEGLSGIRALKLGMQSLQRGEVNAALVGAVDFSANEIDRYVAKKMDDPFSDRLGDAAVVFVLKRLQDAVADKDRIFCILDEDVEEQSVSLMLNETSLVCKFGYTHAAAGLMPVASAVLACHHGLRPALSEEAAEMWITVGHKNIAEVNVTSFTGKNTSVYIRQYDYHVIERLYDHKLPTIRLFAGDTVEELINHIDSNTYNSSGKLCLAVVARDVDSHEKRKVWAKQQILQQPDRTLNFPAKGVYFYPKPLEGEIAFIFASSNTVYRGAGSGLLQSHSDLIETFLAKYPETMTQAILDNLYGGHYHNDNFLEDIELGIFLCQLHHVICTKLFGITTDKVIGHSVGEVNAFAVLDVYQNATLAHNIMRSSRLLHDWLDGEYHVLDRVWDHKKYGKKAWANYRVVGDLVEIDRLLAGIEFCEITIINSENDFVVSGVPEVCQAFFDRMGLKPVKLPIDLLIHTALAEEAIGDWKYKFLENLNDDNEYTFYSCITGEKYHPDAKSTEKFWTLIFSDQVDFPQAVNNAYADGVRTFIEFGAGGLCSYWIDKILGEREHVAVPFDRYGVDSVDQVIHLIAKLKAAGIRVDPTALFEKGEIDG